MLILAGKFGFSEFTKKILIVCAVVGMLGIVAFGARDAETLMGRIGGGIYSLYGVTSVSYTHLVPVYDAIGFYDKELKDIKAEEFLDVVRKHACLLYTSIF